jgi:hypothetical protein
VGQVGARLLQRVDAEKLCRRTASEDAQLRKDEPDPVAAFGAGAQLGQHPVVDAVLSVDETLEIGRVVHLSTVPHP